ncbi:lytic transglycosylase domain-containing protein [Streptomyces sp. NPDC051940]|uniref:lytic transglycosylase domain-containing protein n=1 Tax=Streptomyces sp. NPDC051940 TaxID=3155675 RepID=UPI0034283816
MRRGTIRAGIATAAMVALTASQAPGFGHGAGAPRRPLAKPLPPGQPGDFSYHTELPPLAKPDESGGLPPDLPQLLDTQSGIPATVLAAYQRAEAAVKRTDAGCRLPWQLLAAIGKVESGHARGGRVDAAGTTRGAILGPVLNGVDFALVADTDGGRLDGDKVYDRAVGPMQFIPSTWATWGVDGNGDGVKNPHNVFDAALAAGHYLCAGSRDLALVGDLERAILSYNRSDAYLRTVLSWLEFYRRGVHTVPDGTGVVPTSPGAGNPQSQEDNDYNGDGKEDGGGITVGPQPPTTGTPSPRPSLPGTSPSPTDDPTTDPTDPTTDPTDPTTDPTDPTTDPTDPTTDPTDPTTDPTDPTTDPTDPTTDPTDPTTDPTETTAPTDPGTTDPTQTTGAESTPSETSADESPAG